ncbi:MAG: FHA domain-containing protein [Actinomycetota bacterium]
MVAALDPTPGRSATRSLRVDRSGTVLAPDRPVVRLDLRSGDRVAIVQLGVDTVLDHGPDPAVELRAVIRMLTGPLAGRQFELPAGVNTIGRAASNDLTLADPGISRHHATIAVDAAAVVVADLGSTNGIRIEGVPIDGPTAIRSGQRLLLGQSWVTVEHHGVPVVPVDGRVRFDRPQRLVSPYVGRTFEVPAPPDDSEAAGRRLPLGGRSQLRQLARAYDQVIDQVVADLNLARRQEREARSAEDPSVDDVLLGVRSQTRLWERRLTDPDALVVRLGLAELVSRHRIEVAPGGPAALRRRVDRLPDTYTLIDGVPATFDLGRPGGLTIRGDRDRILPVATSLVAQLVGLNPPDQLGVLVCGDRADDWDWVKWLPHVAVGHGETQPTGADALRLAGRLLEADPAAEVDGVDRPPFLLVVVDGEAGGPTSPELRSIVDRLLAEGSQRGLHPLVLDPGPPLVAPANPSSVAAPTGARSVLGVTGATARLSAPGAVAADVDPIAVESLSASAATELARLLAALVLGPGAHARLPSGADAGADGGRRATSSGGPSRPRPPSHDGALVTVQPLVLGSPVVDDGPLDLFELPRSPGDSRLVLGRVAMPDETETVLAFNPPRDGTLGLIGPPGSERSGCLLTVAASAARLGVEADQRPLIYAFGDGASLDGLGALPLTVRVAGNDPVVAIEALADVEQRLDDRLLTFELAGVDDLEGFREARPQVGLRRVLVVIDGLARLTSLLEPGYPGRTREVVGQLLEIGSGLGVHLVLTAEDRDQVDPLLVPKVGRWLEIDGSVDRPGRVLLDGAAVRLAVPGGSWDPGDINRALAEMGDRLTAELEPVTGDQADVVTAE